jgi:hypothetical protein
MAVPRKRTPLAIRLSRARRRAVSRRALVVHRVSTASVALVDTWSTPDPLVAGGPSLRLSPAIGSTEIPPLAIPPLPLGDVPPPDDGVPTGRLRRCAFRRLDVVEPGQRRASATYEVMCLFGAVAEPVRLGDLPSAAVACRACTYTGIFRPDES